MSDPTTEGVTSETPGSAKAKLSPGKSPRGVTYVTPPECETRFVFPCKLEEQLAAQDPAALAGLADTLWELVANATRENESPQVASSPEPSPVANATHRQITAALAAKLDRVAP